MYRVRWANFLKLVAAVGLVVILFGCDEILKTSVDDRINMFFDDLNTGGSKYATIRGDHIHPDCNEYPNMDSDYWSTSLTWSNTPFTVTSSNIPNNTSVSVNVTTGSGATTFDMTMKEDGEDNWKILAVSGYFN